MTRDTGEEVHAVVDLTSTAPDPIRTSPVTGAEALRLATHGVRVRVRWSWLRVADATIDPVTGLLRRAEVVALLPADDGSGLVWRPDSAVLARLHRPGCTTLLAHADGDPSRWTPLRWWEDAPVAPTGSRGWSGGDVAGGMPHLDDERASFLTGRRATGTVSRVRSELGSADGDGVGFEIVFVVDGTRQPWSGRLSIVNDELRRGDQVELALDDDGAIIALDTDERYVSDKGRCLVWSSEARLLAARDRAAGDARRRVPPAVNAPSPVSASAPATAPPPGTAAPEPATAPAAARPAGPRPLAAPRIFAVRPPAPEPIGPQAGAGSATGSTWAGVLQRAKLRNDISAMSALRTYGEGLYEQRVRVTLAAALARGEIDPATYAELLHQAGVDEV